MRCNEQATMIYCSQQVFTWRASFRERTSKIGFSIQSISITKVQSVLLLTKLLILK